MQKKEFNKLLKNDTRKHILFLYTTNKIFLTSRQLDLVLAKEV